MASPTTETAGVDRSPVTLVAYGVLLLTYAISAWVAFAAVVVLFFGDDDEFGRNMLFLLIWGPACLLIAVPTSVAFLRLARRRWASYSTLIKWSALDIVATLLVLRQQGFFNFDSQDYRYILESSDVQHVAILLVVGTLVLGLTLIDMRSRPTRANFATKARSRS